MGPLEILKVYWIGGSDSQIAWYPGTRVHLFTFWVFSSLQIAGSLVGVGFAFCMLPIGSFTGILLFKFKGYFSF